MENNVNIETAQYFVAQLLIKMAELFEQKTLISKPNFTFATPQNFPCKLSSCTWL